MTRTIKLDLFCEKDIYIIRVVLMISLLFVFLLCSQKVMAEIDHYTALQMEWGMQRHSAPTGRYYYRSSFGSSRYSTWYKVRRRNEGNRKYTYNAYDNYRERQHRIGTTNIKL